MKIGKAKGLEYLQFKGISYSRYQDKCDGHARGEMFIHSGRTRRVVSDYPHIFRVYRLSEGVEGFLAAALFLQRRRWTATTSGL